MDINEKIPCMNCGSIDTNVYPYENKDVLIVECNTCGFQLEFSIK